MLSALLSVTPFLGRLVAPRRHAEWESSMEVAQLTGQGQDREP